MDVFLFQTADGGDIEYVNGTVRMSPGLETSAYLSMFGGNVDDDGRPGNALTWWGNIDETIPARRYTSETQNLLAALTLTTTNLLRVDDAVKRDLSWYVTESVASAVTSETRATGLNRVDIAAGIQAVGSQENFNFFENWAAYGTTNPDNSNS